MSRDSCCVTGHYGERIEAARRSGEVISMLIDGTGGVRCPGGTGRLSVRVLLLAALLLPTSACTRRGEVQLPEERSPASGPRPDSEQWHATINLFESGHTQAVIRARYLALFQLPEKNYTHLDSLDVDLYDAAGEPSSHLIAEAGEIYDQDREGRRQVKTWGGVVLTAPEERTVRADTLWWDEARDRVYTYGPFEMFREGEYIQGVGLDADTRLETFRFLNASGWSLEGGQWLESEGETERTAPPDSTRSIPPDTIGTIPPDTSRIRP